MRLKKVTVGGFKSFRDRTVVQFGEGVTAIVGPNGCGKSNLLDAVRWVLGESSARALRGGKMPDVLFGGTEKSKGRGIAEVKALFETPNDCLGIGLSEVEITRRLSSDGGSEYLVNDRPIRLRDLQVLLHKMGLGKEGFWMFEQGRVDQVVSWSPEERRSVFEETSGISLFLSQKRDALEKLKETKIALDRLLEREKEATKLLELLKTQAETTEKYLKVKERSHVVQKELFMARFTSLTSDYEREVHRLNHLLKEIKIFESEETELTKLSLPLEKEKAALEEIMKELQANTFRLHHQIDALQKELEALRIRERQLESASRDRKDRIEKEERNQERLKKEIETLKQETTPPHFEKLKKSLDELLERREKEEIQVEKLLIEEKNEEKKRLEALTKKHTLEKRWVEIDQLKQGQEELLRLKQKAQSLKESIEKKKIENAKADLEALFKEIDEREKTFAELKKKERLLEEDRATTAGHLRSLEELIKKNPKKLEGNEKILKWSEEPHSPLKGKVAPLLSRFSLSGDLLEKGCALFGLSFEAIVLDEPSLLDDLLHRLKGLPFSIYVGKDPAASITSIPSVNGALHHPLGWIISATANVSHPLLLEEERTELQKHAGEVSQAIKALKEEEGEIEKTLISQRRLIKELQKKESQHQEELNKLAWELEKTEELIGYAKPSLVNPEEETLLKETLATLVILPPPAHGISIKQKLDKLRLEEKDLRQKISFEEKKIEDQTKTFLLKERECQEKEREKNRLQSERDDILKKLNGLPENIRKLEEQLEALKKNQTEVDQSLKTKQQESSLLSHQAFSSRKRLEELRLEINKMKIEEERCKGALTALKEKRGVLEAEVFEQLGVSPEFLSHESSSRPLKDLEKEWKEIKKNLDNFSDISLTALERYKCEVEEADKLRQEIVDLHEAHKKALEWIDQLDLESEKKFLEVFEQVNKAFREAFQRLFRGGDAKLFLGRPQEPLVSGIELQAQPPGKAVRSAHLLSGGEKCLVGIALLIALFSVKKAPIALFDEVDAPLDEANLERFLDLLVPFSEETQVILVTHKRRTMEVASELIGVTMAEKGVSKILSLPLLETFPLEAMAENSVG